jgi:hypothetical protein
MNTKNMGRRLREQIARMTIFICSLFVRFDVLSTCRKISALHRGGF